jgi:hypothetical protein
MSATENPQQLSSQLTNFYTPTPIKMLICSCNFNQLKHKTVQLLQLMALVFNTSDKTVTI